MRLGLFVDPRARRGRHGANAPAPAVADDADVNALLGQGRLMPP